MKKLLVILLLFYFAPIYGQNYGTWRLIDSIPNVTISNIFVYDSLTSIYAYAYFNIDDFINNRVSGKGIKITRNGGLTWKTVWGDSIGVIDGVKYGEGDSKRIESVKFISSEEYYFATTEGLIIKVTNNEASIDTLLNMGVGSRTYLLGQQRNNTVSYNTYNNIIYSNDSWASLDTIYIPDSLLYVEDVDRYSLNHYFMYGDTIITTLYSLNWGLTKNLISYDFGGTWKDYKSGGASKKTDYGYGGPESLFMLNEKVGYQYGSAYFNWSDPNLNDPSFLIYKTEDGCNTWEEIYRSDTIRNLRPIFLDESNIFLATYRNIYFSADGMKSLVPTDYYFPQLINFDVTSPTVGYAINGGGKIYKLFFPTSVEFEDESKFSIFPNINYGNFYFEFESDFIGNGEIDIYDINGNKIFTKSILKSNKIYSDQINLPSIGIGTYLISISSKEKRIVSKFNIIK